MNNVISYKDPRPEMSEEESWAEHNRVLKAYFSVPWEELAPNDKAAALNYKRQLQSSAGLSLEMVKKMNKLHEIYLDFHVCCIP